jgi:hypothetical protein
MAAFQALHLKMILFHFSATGLARTPQSKYKIWKNGFTLYSQLQLHQKNVLLSTRPEQSLELPQF